MSSAMPAPHAAVRDRGRDPLDGFTVARQTGCPAPFVRDQRLLAGGHDHLAQPGMNRSHVGHGVREAGRPGRDHQHVLEVELPAGVEPAADEVDHRQRDRRPRAAQLRDVLVERHVMGQGGGPTRGERHRQHRVGAETRPGRCAIDLDHAAVERVLFVRRHAADGRSDDVLDVRDGCPHAATPISGRIPVTQLDRFVGSR